MPDYHYGDDQRTPSFVNRRKYPRAPIKRRTVFEGVGSTGFVRDGTAVDISVEGLQIRTKLPESVNATIQIELYPNAHNTEGEPDLLKGQVVWVKEFEGEWAMGVRLKTNPIAAGLPKRASGAIRDAGPMRANAARDAADTPPEDSPPALPRKVKFRETKRDSIRDIHKRRLMWVVYVLVVILIFLFQYGVGRETTQQEAPPEENLRVIEEPETQPPPGDEATLDDFDVRRLRWAAFNVDRLLNIAQLRLVAGDFMSAQELFGLVQTRRDASDLQRFLAELGNAHADAAHGKVNAALERLRRANETYDAVPEPWRSAAHELANQLQKGAPFATLATMNRRLDLVPRKSRESAEPFRVVIDPERYTLTIERGGRPLHVFPVGLGAAGTTPSGGFTIANKISNPDWFNRGEVVLAGDPENPLGESWMGLGRDGAATSYGIHPTDDLHSVGANLSRGCIRLYSADAQTLFRLVPLGTPVDILPCRSDDT